MTTFIFQLRAITSIPVDKEEHKYAYAFKKRGGFYNLQEQQQKTSYSMLLPTETFLTRKVRRPSKKE